MPKERIKAFIFRKNGTMDQRRFFQYTTKATGNMEIKSITSIAVYSLPINPKTEFLSGSYQIDRNCFLARTNKNDNIAILLYLRQVYLLNIFKINE